MSYSFAIVLSAFFGLLIVVLKSAIHEPPPASCGPTPSHKCKSDAETAPVTPVRRPRSLELGSGKVLIGIAKRSFFDIDCFQIETKEDLEENLHKFN